MNAERRIVDNRVFLLGLDELYRAAIKAHEKTELLQCAVLLARDLSLTPADAPVEGYYSEDDELTSYFRLMRSLQNEPESRRTEIRHVEAYDRLQAVTESPIFGVPSDSDRLLRQGRNALYYALETLGEDFSIEKITNTAYDIAAGSDEVSLVALAALARDPVVIAALGESVVLYSAVYVIGIPEPVQYDWQVEPVVEARAQQFVDEFNKLFGESLPRPCADNAARFGDACSMEQALGRCVRIAVDNPVSPTRHYHWAIDFGEDDTLEVTDFWDTRLWTTAGYRKERGY